MPSAIISKGGYQRPRKVYKLNLQGGLKWNLEKEWKN